MNTTSTTNTAAASGAKLLQTAADAIDGMLHICCNGTDISPISTAWERGEKVLAELRAALAAPAQAVPPANVDSAPLYLNLNDRAMWVLGWNACLDKARAAQGGHA